jgi:hypothetical protein
VHLPAYRPFISYGYVLACKQTLVPMSIQLGFTRHLPVQLLLLVVLSIDQSDIIRLMMQVISEKLVAATRL